MEALERFNTIESNGLIWIDVREPNRNNLMVLSSIYPLDQLNIEDALSKIQLPKVDRHEDHIFVIIHFPIYEGGIPKQAQISIFVGVDYVITIHKGEIKPLIDLFNQCKKDDNLKSSIMGTSSGHLLYKIIDTLVDELLHTLIKIEGNIEDVEDLVFDENISAIRNITYLRREILLLKRIILPLRRIISDVAKDLQRFSNTDLTKYLSDVNDHIEKAVEVLDVAEDTVDIFRDTDFILNTEKTNKILAILTIVFTLSIPATLIAAFYGMNVNLPGGGSEWTFLGKYTTFIIMLALSFASATFMLLYFRRRGWLI